MVDTILLDLFMRLTFDVASGIDPVLNCKIAKHQTIGVSFFKSSSLERIHNSQSHIVSTSRLALSLKYILPVVCCNHLTMHLSTPLFIALALGGAQAFQQAFIPKVARFDNSPLQATASEKDLDLVTSDRRAFMFNSFAAATFLAVNLNFPVSAQAADSASVDYKVVSADIADMITKDPDRGPTLVRLAWHSSGTYDKMTKTGGSGGGTIRFQEELVHGGNAGLASTAVQWMEPIKKKYDGLSYADLYTLGGGTLLPILMLLPMLLLYLFRMSVLYICSPFCLCNPSLQLLQLKPWVGPLFLGAADASTRLIRLPLPPTDASPTPTVALRAPTRPIWIIYAVFSIAWVSTIKKSFAFQALTLWGDAMLPLLDTTVLGRLLLQRLTICISPF
jgi:hypothetical protein